MVKILTLSGASGAGKSTIAKELLKNKKNFKLIVSYTTRPPRTTDLTGEYAYINKKEFIALKEKSAFLWTAEVRGQFYGTLKKSITEAIYAKDNRLAIMILVPEALKILLDNLAIPDIVLPFFIETPNSEIKARLTKEGKTPEEIEKRLNDKRRWEEEMKRLHMRYFKILNQNSIQETVYEILKIVSQKQISVL